MGDSMLMVTARICFMFMAAFLSVQSLYPTTVSEFIQSNSEADDTHVEKFIQHYFFERQDLQDGQELLDVWCDVVQTVAEVVVQKMSQLAIDTRDENYCEVARKLSCNRYIQACFTAEQNQPLEKTKLTECFLQVFDGLYTDDPSQVVRSFADLTSAFCDENIMPAHRAFYKVICNYARQVGCKKLILDVIDTYKDNFEFDIHQTTSGNNLVFE